MGANYIEATLPGNKSRSEVIEAFKSWQEVDGHESGHGSYAGNWTCLNGVEFKGRTFESEGEAAEYVADHAEKWGSALAVKFKAAPTLAKAPTFGGEKATLHFGQDKRCYTVSYKGGSNRAVAADQLTEPQKARCIKLYTESHEAQGECRHADNEFQKVLAQFTKDPEWWDGKALKSARSAAYKARAKRDKKAAALKEFNDRMVKKLYKEKASTAVNWLIGGLASS